MLGKSRADANNMGWPQMRTVAKCAAIASVVLLTTGSAACAQGYGNNAANYGNQSYNQGYNQGYQGTNAGNWGGNQAGWGQGMQGSGQYSENTGAGFGSSNNTNYAFAQRELAQYGYTDIPQSPSNARLVGRCHEERQNGARHPG